MQLPMHFNINLPERMVMIENIVQPASAPEVSVPITVQPAQVTLEAPDINLQPAAVNVNNQFDVQPGAAPKVSLSAPITVNPPPAALSQGVEVEYDADGRVVGTRPRRNRRG